MSNATPATPAALPVSPEQRTIVALARTVFRLMHQMEHLGENARDSIRGFDPDDVLRSVGLMRTRSAQTVMGGAGAFLLGAAVGGLAALMLAPRTGNELRTTVMDRANQLLHRNTGAATSTQPTATA